MAKVEVQYVSDSKFHFDIEVGGKTKKYTATINGTTKQQVVQKIGEFTKKFLVDLGEMFEATRTDFSKVDLRKISASGLYAKIDKSSETGDGKPAEENAQRFEEITPFVAKVTKDLYAKDFGIQNEEIKAEARRLLPGDTDNDDDDEIEERKSNSSFMQSGFDFTKAVWDTVCTIDILSPDLSPIPKASLKAKQDEQTDNVVVQSKRVNRRILSELFAVASVPNPNDTLVQGGGAAAAIGDDTGNLTEITSVSQIIYDDDDDDDNVDDNDPINNSVEIILDATAIPDL